MRDASSMDAIPDPERALGFGVDAVRSSCSAAAGKAFSNGTRFTSNFSCKIGYADGTALFQRLPRFHVDEIFQPI